MATGENYAESRALTADWGRIDTWLSVVKKAEARDKRDSDTVSIAVEANRTAKQGNISLLAAIAAILSTAVAQLRRKPANVSRVRKGR
jgi:hypothetical protein